MEKVVHVYDVHIEIHIYTQNNSNSEVSIAEADKLDFRSLYFADMLISNYHGKALTGIPRSILTACVLHCLSMRRCRLPVNPSALTRRGLLNRRLYYIEFCET